MNTDDCSCCTQEKAHSWNKVFQEKKKNSLYSVFLTVLKTYFVLMECFIWNIYWDTITWIRNLEYKKKKKKLTALRGF